MMVRFDMRYLLFAVIVLAGCEVAPPNTVQPDPVSFVEVGTVTAHGVFATKDALAKSGIPAYIDGSDYPLPYRILVPPEYRERAIAILKQIEQDPLSVGYGITHK